MLGMFGLLGALLAGLALDSFIGGMTETPDDQQDDPEPVSPETTDKAGTDENIMDWLGDGNDDPADPDYVPQSTDAIHSDDPDLMMQGHDGVDVMSGQGGDDTVIGGTGDDQLSGRDGNDALMGDEGNDMAHGGAGAEHSRPGEP